MSSIPSPMATGRLNALRWEGQPGHYEVWYLSLTDRASGCGVWIRYTMVAPSDGGQATASLWLMAMEPDGNGAPIARKATWPADALTARAEPFELRIADAVLTEGGADGAFEDVAWSLSWAPDPHPAEHVHPLLQRARVAKTVLVLPQPDLAISGSVRWGDRELALDGARGGQAHIWGSKHANRWAWVHCNDLETVTGEPRRGDYVDGVSVFVPRFGRELGPNTPVVGRFAGREMRLDEAMEAKIAEILSGFAQRFKLDQEALLAANRKQAMVPEGAVALDPVGTAPGLVVPAGERVVIVLPGPPRELQPMWPVALETEPVRQLLSRATPLHGYTMRMFGVPESEIAKSLREMESGGVELVEDVRDPQHPVESDRRQQEPEGEQDGAGDVEDHQNGPPRVT